MRVNCRFAKDPASASEARHLVVSALGTVPPHISEMVELLASELATNAIRYTEDGFSLEIELTDRQVRVEVTDAGPGLPSVQSPATLSSSGRGLRIVDAVADHWGVRSGSGQKTVWFSMALPPAQG